MALVHVKSTPITNADAVPPVASTTGEGAPGNIRDVSGSVVATAAANVDSTFRIARIPSNAKVRAITFQSQAQGAGKFDIGLYYPTTGPTGLPDLAANAISQAFFASAVDCAALVAPTNVVNESGTYTQDKYVQPIWQAVGLSSDPGGYFDIVATVVTTAVTTGTGIMGANVAFVM